MSWRLAVAVMNEACCAYYGRVSGRFSGHLPPLSVTQEGRFRGGLWILSIAVGVLGVSLKHASELKKPSGLGVGCVEVSYG